MESRAARPQDGNNVSSMRRLPGPTRRPAWTANVRLGSGVLSGASDHGVSEALYLNDPDAAAAAGAATAPATSADAGEHGSPPVCSPAFDPRPGGCGDARPPDPDAPRPDRLERRGPLHHPQRRAPGRYRPPAGRGGRRHGRDRDRPDLLLAAAARAADRGGGGGRQAARTARGRPAADRDRRRPVRGDDGGGARAGPLAEEFAAWHTDGEPRFPEGAETFDHALARMRRSSTSTATCRVRP